MKWPLSINRRLATTGRWLAAGILLVVAVVSIGLWARSWTFTDSLTAMRFSPGTRSDYSLQSRWGRLHLAIAYRKSPDEQWVAHTTAGAATMGKLMATTNRTGPLPPSTFPRVLWFSASVCQTVNSGSTLGHKDLLIPFWAIAAVAGFFPCVQYRQWRSARRQSRQGLCSYCGYDLRATPNRCPECGHKTMQLHA